MSEYYAAFLEMVTSSSDGASTHELHYSEEIDITAAYGGEGYDIKALASSSGAIYAGLGLLLVIGCIIMRMWRRNRGGVSSSEARPAGLDAAADKMKMPIFSRTSHVKPAEMTLKVVGCLPCWIQRMVSKACRVNCAILEFALKMLIKIASTMISLIEATYKRIAVVVVVVMSFFACVAERTDARLLAIKR